jgi:hypothetical protein
MNTFERMEIISEIEALCAALDLKLTICLEDQTDLSLIGLRDALASVEQDAAA